MFCSRSLKPFLLKNVKLNNSADGTVHNGSSKQKTLKNRSFLLLLAHCKKKGIVQIQTVVGIKTDQLLV